MADNTHFERCGHTVELGTCTLPTGHLYGHHDETSPSGWDSAQWWDASEDYGRGAYRSIKPGDAVWRHEPGGCVETGARKDAGWCLWCLRAERDALRAERDQYRIVTRALWTMWQHIGDQCPGDEGCPRCDSAVDVFLAEFPKLPPGWAAPDAVLASKDGTT